MINSLEVKLLSQKVYEFVILTHGAKWPSVKSDNLCPRSQEGDAQSCYRPGRDCQSGEAGGVTISQWSFCLFVFYISFISEVEYLFLFNPLVSPFCWLLLMSFSMQTLKSVVPYLGCVVRRGMVTFRFPKDKPR